LLFGVYVCTRVPSSEALETNRFARRRRRRIASVFGGGEYDSWQCAARARVFDGSNRFGPMLPCHVAERVNGGSK
jgi:hypothetical protein